MEATTGGNGIFVYDLIAEGELWECEELWRRFGFVGDWGLWCQSQKHKQRSTVK